MKYTRILPALFLPVLRQACQLCGPYQLVSGAEELQVEQLLLGQCLWFVEAPAEHGEGLLGLAGIRQALA